MRDGCKPFVLIVALAALGALLAAPARAQEPTDGIRFGAFSIHPSLYAALRFNDNIYFLPYGYRPLNQQSIPQSIESDFIFNVVPAVTFDINVPSFHMQAGYRFYNDSYLHYDDPNREHQLLDGNNHNVNGLVDYNAPFGFMIGASDVWSKIGIYEYTGQYVDYLRGEQYHNDGRAWIGGRAGPWDNIYFKATAIDLIDKYARFPQYNKNSEIADGQLRFKFYPETAFVIEGEYGLVDHVRLKQFNSSNVCWAQSGLQGDLTTFLIASFKGGYSTAHYDVNPSYTTWRAVAELTWVFPGQTQWLMGYRHFAADGVDTHFIETHQGVTTFSTIWNSKLKTSFGGTYNYNLYSEPDDRHEILVVANADITYRLVYWLYMGIGYELEYQILHYVTPALAATTAVRNTGILHMEAKF